MKKYKYGEIILESRDFEEVKNRMLELKESGYKIGDWPDERLNTKIYTYLIIVNDDNYLDVEYRIPSRDTEIITLSELNHYKQSGLYKNK